MNQQLQAIKEKAFLEKQRIAVDHPLWNPQLDVRLLCFARFVHIFDVCQFDLEILSNLLNKDWYLNFMKGETQQLPVYKENFIAVYENQTKVRFGLNLFILIETSFRIFLRALDPVACTGATMEFESIYKSLLGPGHLNLSIADKNNAEELLDFVRQVRNLIHNDGVYFFKDGKDKIIQFDGNYYHLYQGKPVDFVTWKLLLNLAEEFWKLLVQIISNPKIISLKDVMDPFKSNRQDQLL